MSDDPRIPEQIWCEVNEWPHDIENPELEGYWSVREGEGVEYVRRDLVNTIVQAALERAAERFDEIAHHDQGGIDYSDAVGIPISNRADLERSVRDALLDAASIRALANDPAEVAAIIKEVEDKTNE